MMLLFQQDFEACTQALHHMGYSNPQLTAARGTSAGGLIAGAVCNRSPGLFKAAILRVGLRFYFGLTWQCYYWPLVLLIITSVLIIKPMPICITPVFKKNPIIEKYRVTHLLVLFSISLMLSIACVFWTNYLYR